MLTRLYCGVVAHLKSERGTTAVEYAVMVALVAAGLILAVTVLRDAIIGVLGRVSDAVSSG